MSTRDPIVVQLRAARQRRRLSLQRFEEKSGLLAVVVGSYERGDRKPSIDKLREWCAALDHELVALGPAEDAAGNAWTEWAVRYDRPDVETGTDLIVCDSLDEAEAIAAVVASGRVVWRRVRVTDWAEATEGGGRPW